MFRTILVVGTILAIGPLALAATKQESEEERTFLIGLQVPVLQFTHDEDDNDNLDFGVNPVAANLVFGFQPTEPVWILARFGFNLHFAGDENTQNDMLLGVGIRGDFSFGKLVGLLGLFLEYHYYAFPQSDNDLEAHGIGIVPFGGVEYMVTDYFSVGGQLHLGYLWVRAEADAAGPGGGRISNEINGMILALILSASVYF